MCSRRQQVSLHSLCQPARQTMLAFMIQHVISFNCAGCAYSPEPCSSGQPFDKAYSLPDAALPGLLLSPSPAKASRHKAAKVTEGALCRTCVQPWDLT